MKNVANIINFVRACEPRAEDGSFLFETLKNELELCKKYGFKSTVLFQYDALIDNRYVELVNEHTELVELGLWFEVVQPLCKDSDIKWNGRYPWDWHNDVGFLIGYMPEERKALIDTAFKKFKSIFGYFPSVVGSWHIDAFSLRYMKEKYDIIASCNCKEQCLTDGYTLWGGIYNGAYYPSKNNMLCPAQTSETQINVPVFRMLGADPIHQYDLGLGNPEKGQAVISLEPVYPESGGKKEWVEWYLKENFNDNNLNLSYTQFGQENSFGWDRIGTGLAMQFELLNAKILNKEIELLTLGKTGKVFSEKFEFTPAQSMCIDSDYSEKNYKTLWYYSRFFRANILYQNGYIWLRDLFVFNESFTEKYLDAREETHNCEYNNLPVMDGFQFSDSEKRAGIYFCKDGERISFSGEYLSKKIDEKTAEISVGDEVKITLNEDRISICCNKEYCLKFLYADGKIPYKNLSKDKLFLNYKNFDYSISLEKGHFTSDNNGINITPENGRIIFKF